MADDDGRDPQAEALAKADALTKALNGFTARLEQLTQYGRRNRRMIWGLVVSFVLDLALTIPIAWAVVHANDANDLAKANHVSQVQTCVASNDSRRDVRELWGKLFALSPAPKTDEQRKRLGEFRAYIDKTYAPRDCSKI